MTRGSGRHVACLWKAPMSAPSFRSISICLAVAAAGCVGDAPNQYGGSDDPGAPGAIDPMSELALSNSEQTAFNFFVSKGLTNVQAAGIVGNLMQESSVIATSVQYGGGPGRGIAQWSVGGRWDTSHNDNMAAYASANGLSRWSLNAQLGFIWYELTTFSGYGLASLRASTTLTQAVVVFQNKYEICGACASSQRITYAQQVLNNYGAGGGGGGGGGGTTGATCYSNTLGQEMPENACVQSRSDSQWYQCSNGLWIDRWTDPAPCNGVHPL
ncbi:MAG: peptidase [Myxococcales bacterium]|nr:peptidase [Myxococcales bacterium]